MFFYLTMGKDSFSVQLSFVQSDEMVITVHPNLKIEARFPLGTSHDIVEKKIHSKRRWIIKQIQYFHDFLPSQSKKKFLPGETHLYLGRQYILKEILSNREEIKLTRNTIELQKKNKSKQTEAVLERWYEQQSKRIFKERFDLYLPKFKRYQKDDVNLKVRKMQKRWGSYTSKHTVIINSELVKTSIYCIDYVIVHELCHMVSLKHDETFFRVLRRILPDWEKRKKKLEKTLYSL